MPRSVKTELGLGRHDIYFQMIFKLFTGGLWRMDKTPRANSKLTSDPAMMMNRSPGFWGQHSQQRAENTIPWIYIRTNVHKNMQRKIAGR
jgi:hypothetical protein